MWVQAMEQVPRVELRQSQHLALDFASDKKDYNRVNKENPCPILKQSLAR